MSQRATLLEGSLDDIELANVVQTVSVSRRSVTLELREPGGAVFGTLVLKAGQIVSAASEGLSGIDALRKLVAARRPGRFLVYRASGVDLREHLGPVADVLSSVLAAPGPGGSDAPGVLAHGSLDTLELRAVIDVLSLSRQSVTLELFAADGTRLGALALKGGQVLSASAGSDAGLLAARALLEARPAGRFVVRAARAAVSEPLFSVQALLGEPAREENLLEVADEDIAEADADDAPVTQVAPRPTPSQAPPARSRPPPVPSQPPPPPGKRAASVPPRASAPPLPVTLHGETAGPGPASVRPAPGHPLPPPSPVARDAGAWPLASAALPGAVVPGAPARVASVRPEAAVARAREIAGAKTEPRASAPWLGAAPALDDEEPHLLLQPKAPRSSPPAQAELAARDGAPAEPNLPAVAAAPPPQRVNGDATAPHAPSLASAVALQEASQVSRPAVASAPKPSEAPQAPKPEFVPAPTHLPSVAAQAAPAARPTPVRPPSVAPDAEPSSAHPQSLAPQTDTAQEPSPARAQSVAPQAGPTAEASSARPPSLAPPAGPAAEPSPARRPSVAPQAGPAAEPSPARPPSGRPPAAKPTADRAQSAAPPALHARRSEGPAAPPARAASERETPSDATITARHPVVRGGTPIVAITSPKGGAGRSTLALNLAVSLARRGRRVVMVDADASNLLPALDLSDRAFKGVADALEGWAPLADTVLQTRVPGLKLIPSGELTEETYRHPGWQPLLAELAGQADLVLVDCAPGWYGATLSVLEAATHQLLVLAAEPAARRICTAYQARLQKLLKGKPKPELLGLVINMLDYQVHASVRSLEELSTSEYARHVFDIPIPRSPTFMEASARGVPIVHVEQGASSTIAWVFETLATALLERLQLERPTLSSAPLLA